MRFHLLATALILLASLAPEAGAVAPTWKAGIAQTVITPEKTQWLSGYGSKRPAVGKRHDVWVKALALQDGRGRRAVLVTSDLVGISKGMYDRVSAAAKKRFRLDRSQLVLTYSHNHCAPVTTDVLPDYYPLEPDDWKQVDAYSVELERRVLDTIGEALDRLKPARLFTGEGKATFAVNRRNNKEAEVPALLADGKPLLGPVDHSVPLLVVRDPDDRLQALIFGYACHPTTLSDDQWCGDYPGYAQLELQRRHPGATALFWTGCGGDQNPLPRRTVALCEQYGRRLADGVDEALAGKLEPVSPELRTAHDFVTLNFDRRPTRAELEADAKSGNPVRARWAKRVLPLLDAGHRFPESVEYGVSVWRLGQDQLWIGLGGEAVVDYSLRFKRDFGPRTWVAGYAHDMVGYVPSRRVWKEGGYEAEFIYEYGWLAYRWTEDTEDRIVAAVQRLVKKVR
ncbi:MAG: Neutral/alkaline non-lysosomal ceramidase [Armatimonadetes bacterium]|jgi:hypothetical protein|nr:Neutral/alkaline non-lysosomal ceramidase [Armatimonadota bacterium]